VYIFQEHGGPPVCELLVFDFWGRMVCSTRFIASQPIRVMDASKTGYAIEETIHVGNVRFSERAYGFRCLTIEADDIWVGPTRQFYYIGEEHVELLRREKANGTLTGTHWDAFASGETPADFANWEALLNSKECLQQLRGLAAFFSVRDKTMPVGDNVCQRLTELANSSDPWISEEAKVALEEGKER
jgi:hypothetical protein